MSTSSNSSTAAAALTRDAGSIKAIKLVQGCASVEGVGGGAAKK
jgi:hypothetical protein